MNKIKLFLLDLLFPNRCPICSSFITYDSFVCDECFAKLSDNIVDKTNVCEVCGKNYCETHENLHYSRTVSCYYYEETAKKGIISLKGESHNFGFHLAEILSEEIISDNLLKNADFIMPVPMSKQKLRTRGYNQAEVIAREISSRTGIPILKNVLFKHESQAQHTLGLKERQMNVSAFYSKETDLTGKKIILCDDVLTTGSTMNRCAELLINMNAECVYAAAGTIKKYKKE